MNSGGTVEGRDGESQSCGRTTRRLRESVWLTLARRRQILGSGMRNYLTVQAMAMNIVGGTLSGMP